LRMQILIMIRKLKASRPRGSSRKSMPCLSTPPATPKQPRTKARLHSKAANDTYCHTLSKPLQLLLCRKRQLLPNSQHTMKNRPRCLEQCESRLPDQSQLSHIFSPSL
jgi:hypothetical protein